MLWTSSSVALLAMLFCSWGCAAGNKYAYDGVVADLSYSGNTVVTVASYDRRSAVRKHEKPADYVGTQRGGFGNPFDVKTASGRPLAVDMTTSMVSSLVRHGFRARGVATESSDSTTVLASRFAVFPSDRRLLLTIVEWYSDTLANIGLYYDLDLRVLDATGKILAKHRIQASEDIDGSFLDAPAAAKKAVPNAFKAKLEELLNDPGIRDALRAVPNAPRPEKQERKSEVGGIAS
jgi:hypothetical protein